VQLLVLSAIDVHQLLGYGDCVAAVRDALAELAAGQAYQPLRVIVSAPDAPGLMGLMPVHAPVGGYGLKAICITPSNPAAGLDAHQGIVLLSDGQTGEPLAVLNDSFGGLCFPFTRFTHCYDGGRDAGAASGRQGAAVGLVA